MKSNAEKILAQGLAAGYAGQSDIQKATRGSFTLKSSELVFDELNARYNDQWIAKRLGGGQEIAQVGDEMATRIYAGGIVSPEKLKTLDISEEQVITYLKTTLVELAEKTRLHEEVSTKSDGDWQYRYEVVKEYPDLPLTIGIETVSYKGNSVFVHVFLNSPIV